MEETAAESMRTSCSTRSVTRHGFAPFLFTRIGRGAVSGAASWPPVSGQSATQAFARCDTVATLAGEPLYAFFGYAVVKRYDIAMVSGMSLPVVKMSKVI